MGLPINQHRMSSFRTIDPVSSSDFASRGQSLLLLGTDHRFQRGDAEVPRYVINRFSSLIIDTCRLHQVAAIAEEMSTDALVEHGLRESVPACVARTIGLPHRYCDPGRSEQMILGIADENAVRAGSMVRQVPQHEIECLVSAERRKREPIWLARLQELATWPALFICGSWHIPSFSELLKKYGHSPIVIHSDWQA